MESLGTSLNLLGSPCSINLCLLLSWSFRLYRTKGRIFSGSTKKKSKLRFPKSF
jgi:hypothetical protein